MKIEIPIDEIGETLICDDSESYPLGGYGYVIQQELYNVLSWNKDISKRLEKESWSESNEDTWYEKWAEKAQEWAEEKIKKSKLI